MWNIEGFVSQMARLELEDGGGGKYHVSLEWATIQTVKGILNGTQPNVENEQDWLELFDNITRVISQHMFRFGAQPLPYGAARRIGQATVNKLMGTEGLLVDWYRGQLHA